MAKRKPVWKEVEEREKRKISNRVKARRPPGRRRLRVVYDVDGPRVRLGVAWFLANVLALVTGRWSQRCAKLGAPPIEECREGQWPEVW